MIPLELKKAAREVGENFSGDKDVDNHDRIAEELDENLIEALDNALSELEGSENLTDDETEELNDVARAYAECEAIIDEYFKKDSTVKMTTKHLARQEAKQQKITRIKEICDEILEKTAYPLADEPSTLLSMIGKGLKSRIEEIKTIVGEI